MYINLKKPEFAYFFGFVQADGSLTEETRNRGRLSIELNQGDSSLLEAFNELLACDSYLSMRERDTNFIKGYKSITLKVYDKGFRDELIALGMSYGRKSDTIGAPSVDFSEVDYYRGIIDGDGSLGLTGKGFPFLTLVTASESLKDDFLAYVKSITGKKKNVSRNKRDNIYNICIYKEDAQKVVEALYYDGCMGLERKKKKAVKVLSWQRPESMRKVENILYWTAEEDEYIMSHSISESMEHLGRGASSVKMRMWRLRSR
jgi:hypothetical protein